MKKIVSFIILLGSFLLTNIAYPLSLRVPAGMDKGRFGKAAQEKEFYKKRLEKTIVSSLVIIIKPPQEDILFEQNSSGFIIGEDTKNIYIMTAEHNFSSLSRPNSKIKIAFITGETATGKVISGEVARDKSYYYIQKFPLFHSFVKEDIAILAVRKQGLSKDTLAQLRILSIFKGPFKSLIGKYLIVPRINYKSEADREIQVMSKLSLKPVTLRNFLVSITSWLHATFDDSYCPFGFSGSPVITEVDAKPHVVGMLVGTKFDFNDRVGDKGYAISYKVLRNCL